MGNGPRLVLNETSAEIRALSIGPGKYGGRREVSSVAARGREFEFPGKWWAVLGLNQ